MSVVRFPAYDFSDPRAGITVQIEAAKYRRVVRLDAVHQRAYLQRPEGPTWYASRAKVARFPVERTRARGEP